MSEQAIVWCISASDSGGGAGLQADAATCRSFGVHPCHVVTGITAQNSRHLAKVYPLPAEAVDAQIDALAVDLPPAAVKVGALPGADAIGALAPLWTMGAPVVVDPVLRSSTGRALGFSGYRRALLDELLPHVTLLTPNVPECEALTNCVIRTPEDMPRVADALLERGVRAVVIKGGHLEKESAIDYYADDRLRFWLRHERVRTPHGHGTGCAYASAAAAALAMGESLPDAVVLAKMYVHAGLVHGYGVGAGPGPVAHRGWPSDPISLPSLHYDPPPAELPSAFPRCDTAMLGLYACVNTAAWVERLLPLGVRTIQLRNKTLNATLLVEEIRRAQELCRRGGARLFVNDHWQMAAELGAYGVHLGQGDLDAADLPAIRSAGLRLGVSTHSWYELARAHGLRPSYLAFGPIYSTTTKAMPFAPQGLDRLGHWVALTRGYPQVAIGGIDIARAAEVMNQGVGSICVVRAITEAADVAEAVRSLQRSVQLG